MEGERGARQRCAAGGVKPLRLIPLPRPTLRTTGTKPLRSRPMARHRLRPLPPSVLHVLVRLQRLCNQEGCAILRIEVIAESQERVQELSRAARVDHLEARDTRVPGLFDDSTIIVYQGVYPFDLTSPLALLPNQYMRLRKVSLACAFGNTAPGRREMHRASRGAGRTLGPDTCANQARSSTARVCPRVCALVAEALGPAQAVRLQRRAPRAAP